MISTALSLALVVGTAFNTGVTDEAVAPTAKLTIDIRVDVYGFNAVNNTAQDHLVVFGYGEARFVRALPQGAELSWPIPQGGTRGVTLEIMTPDASGWTTSTPISIDLVLQTGGEALILSSDHAGLTAWKETPGSARGTTVGSSAARSARAARPTSNSATAGMTSIRAAQVQLLFHVPSVAGLDNPQPQAPPLIDDEPLPAI